MSVSVIVTDNFGRYIAALALAQGAAASRRDQSHDERIFGMPVSVGDVVGIPFLFWPDRERYREAQT